MKNTLKTALLLSAAAVALSACGTGDHSTAPRTGSVDRALGKAAAEAARTAKPSANLASLERQYNSNPTDAKIATSYGTALREHGQANQSSLVLQSFAAAPDASVVTLREYASTQLELGDYTLAETYARKALAKDNTDAQAWHVLGIALDAQGTHEEAETAFRKALDLWEGDPVPIMNNLALNLASQNHVPEAVEILKKAKELAPNRVEVERNLRIISTLNEGPNDFASTKAQGM
ncbi:MAG: tetratricopeptide repeat protein [Pseudobdellovibrionaceae bacterium]